MAPAGPVAGGGAAALPAPPHCPAWLTCRSGGTFPGTRCYLPPVPLQQLNLKLPASVLRDWRDQATAAGHRSVRDWLLSLTAPALPPVPGLEDRVAALEAAVAAMQHQTFAPPATAPSAPPLAPSQHAAEVVTSAGLAKVLGVDPSAPNKWASSARIGQVWRGWRLLGRADEPGRNGTPPWTWGRVGS